MNSPFKKTSFRKTSQFLMPGIKTSPPEAGKYDIYPVFEIGKGRIFRGIGTLAEKIAREKMVIIDGFEGVFFNLLREDLDALFKRDYNIEFKWIDTYYFFKPEKVIGEMILPFLGDDDPIFGTRTSLTLKDFLEPDKLNSKQRSDPEYPCIIYGPGASLFSDKGLLIYMDLPKNELQFRSRAGTVTNLGASVPSDPKSMYKRFYFVDWVVLNRHKKDILDRIDILADCQRPDDITWTKGDDFRNALHEMSRSTVRARPWFEPGVWGGSWIKDNIPGLNTEAPNYAWSFELISPENGLIIESSGLMLEFSFDFLMYQEARAVLGDCYERFGTAFPIRFDFLDTFDGGNLSIQCHPRPEYIRNNFGEDFTQEETYYILDSKDNAGVYLGFRADIDQDEFRKVLENARNENIPVRIEDFVQFHPAGKHDFFLIPYGTIHGSGINNLVLEISSTPYIFTFKLYDWLRPDLDGKPRPVNIERGMDNLFFERKGEKVTEELICKSVLIEEGKDWQLFHLPTHPTHLYDVHRYVVGTTLEIVTGNKCHVLNLVEGKSITVSTKNGVTRVINYAETFIVPASAISYTIRNQSNTPAVLVKAFVK